VPIMSRAFEFTSYRRVRRSPNARRPHVEELEARDVPAVLGLEVVALPTPAAVTHASPVAIAVLDSLSSAPGTAPGATNVGGRASTPAATPAQPTPAATTAGPELLVIFASPRGAEAVIIFAPVAPAAPAAVAATNVLPTNASGVTVNPFASQLADVGRPGLSFVANFVNAVPPARPIDPALLPVPVQQAVPTQTGGGYEQVELGQGETDVQPDLSPRRSRHLPAVPAETPAPVALDEQPVAAVLVAPAVELGGNVEDEQAPALDGAIPAEDVTGQTPTSAAESRLPGGAGSRLTALAAAAVFAAQWGAWRRRLRDEETAAQSPR